MVTQRLRKAALVSCVLGVSAPSLTAQEPLVDVQIMAPHIALLAAQTARDDCAARGAQIGVSVTDRFGNLQVFVKDRFAGSHVVETSHRKAWTAASFRSSTSALSEATPAGSEAYGIRALDMALPLGGGLPIFSGAGQLVGAIGVSGAPSPVMDEECAQAALDEIEIELAF